MFTTLVLMADFNHPKTCWWDTTAGHKQSMRFLDCVDENFLFQVIEEPTRRGVMLDLVLTNKEGLVGNVKLKGSPGCRGHEMAHLVECHGIKPWREEGPKKLGEYSRITSSKLGSNASQQRRSQAKTPGGLHG